jgi:hypothetical protein
LATSIVANYGLSDIGITTYAPPSRPPGFMRKSFEVAVDNIDADLFGRGTRGGGFQPADQTWTTVQRHVFGLIEDAYQKNLRTLHAHKQALKSATELILVAEEMPGHKLVEIMTQYPPSEMPADYQNGNGRGPQGTAGSKASQYATASAN